MIPQVGSRLEVGLSIRRLGCMVGMGMESEPKGLSRRVVDGYVRKSRLAFLFLCVGWGGLNYGFVGLAVKNVSVSMGSG